MVKPTYDVEFVNIELRYKPTFYVEKTEVLPNESQLCKWLEEMAGDFYRFGFSYNERSGSFTASLTWKGGKTTDKSPCVTQHGKSFLSACQKLYVVFEVVGGREFGLKHASDALEQLEVYIEQRLEQLG